MNYPQGNSRASSVFALVLSFIAAYLPDFLTDSIQGLEGGAPKFMITAAVVIVLIAIWSWLINHWMSFRWIRRLSRIRSLEGVWIELLYKNNDAPVTCAIIKFGSNGEIIYQGDNYSKQGTRVAHFYCDHTELIRSGRRLIFEFSGKVFKSNNTLDDVQMTKGEGSIMFIEDRNNKYKRGEGQYTEVGSDKVQYFEIRKLSEEHTGASISSYEPAEVVKEYMASDAFKEFMETHSSEQTSNNTLSKQEPPSGT